MKILRALVILITLIFFLGDKSIAHAALQSVPTNKAPSNQQHLYPADLFTGSASYNYPINVPKGTNDLAPSVTLSYNSMGSKDLANRTGSGWQINQNYIECDTNYTPSSTSDDKFKLHLNGSTHDLVYVSSEDRYHTKIESFLTIQKISTGGQGTYSEYWKVTDKDGTVYRFGYDLTSELMCDGRNYVRNWNLDQVEDLQGNKIFYSYSESSGTAYLTKIEYNTEKARVVELNYNTHPYQRKVYPGGCHLK